MNSSVIILFFAFFLTSRFFSEVLKILPKGIDIIDIPFIVFLACLALLRSKIKDIEDEDNITVIKSIRLFSVMAFLSIIINFNNILVPASSLFIIGFLEGPVLFWSLNRLINNPVYLANQINKLFYVLLITNIIVVLFINIPMFAVTKNPDVMSGTYGRNAYYFSVFLIIMGGLLFGRSIANRQSKLIFILGQGFIFFTFFLLQFRSALPFFLLAYCFLLFVFYGKKIRSVVFTGIIIISIAAGSIYAAQTRILESAYSLKYDAWNEIISNPTEFLQYGKFQAYLKAVEMMLDDPVLILTGVGPGNFVSRAYYTFSYEMEVKGKGIGQIARTIFGMSGPRYTNEDRHYLGPSRGKVVFGSYQLSNPHSSFLAPIAEIGVIGGGIIIYLYIYLVKRSFELLRIARDSVPEYLPLASALVTGSTYLFGLGFLDNYWEMSRATLPVWLLFWAVSTGVNAGLKKYRAVIEIPQKVINNFTEEIPAFQTGRADLK